MLDAGKVQALREACARDAGLRQRLQTSPDEVLKALGIAVQGEPAAALASAILGGELSEAELRGAAGGAFDTYMTPEGGPHE